MILLPTLGFIQIGALVLALWWSIVSFAIGKVLQRRPKPRTSEPQEPYGFAPVTTQRVVPCEWCFGTVPVQGNVIAPSTDVANERPDVSNDEFSYHYLILQAENPEAAAQLLADYNSGLSEAQIQEIMYLTASRERLNCKLAFGDGPFLGRRSGYTMLNAKPAADWTGTTITENRGTDLQTALAAEERNEFTRNDRLLLNTPVVITAPDRDYDDLAVVVGSMNGCVQFAANGSPQVHRFRLKMEVRVVGEEAWNQVMWWYLSAKTTNPVRWRLKVSDKHVYGTPYVVTPGEQHEIRLTCTQNNTGNMAQGELSVMALQQLYGAGHRHPGLAHVLISALAMADLSGNLEYTDIVDAKICELLTLGTFAFSEDPAVVAVNLWTRPCITGDGDSVAYAVDYYRGYDPANIVLADFQAASAWFDDLVPDGNGGTEARYRFDGRFSDMGEAWEQASERVGAMCWMSSWFDGLRVRAWVDKPATPAHIFCDANMLKGTYEEQVVDNSTVPGAIEGTFWVAENGWAAQTVRVVDVNSTSQEIGQADPFGCTHITQFIRWCKRAFDKARNLDLRNSWQTGPCGLDAKPGDVAYVQSDKNGLAIGGRIVEVLATDIVVIDQAVTLPVGGDYRLVIQTIDPSGKHVVSYTVDSLIDEWTVVLTTNLTYTPVKGDVLIYGAAASIHTYRIVGWQPDALGYVSFAGERYKGIYYTRDDDDPAQDVTIFVSGFPYQQKRLEPITRQQLMTAYPESIVWDGNNNDLVAHTSFRFEGDGASTVTWTIVVGSAYGWIRWRGTTYQISATGDPLLDVDSIALLDVDDVMLMDGLINWTTDAYIYWDPLDPTVLNTTNNRAADLDGQERFVLCYNQNGIAYPQPGTRVGKGAQLVGVEEGADVTGDHLEDITHISTTPCPKAAGKKWLNTEWCGDDCVAHWPMDDRLTSTAVLDYSPNGYDGAAQQNTSVLTTPGQITTALSFNGSSDYINLGTFGVGDNISICMWIKTSYTAGEVKLFCKMSSDIGLDFSLLSNGDLSLKCGSVAGSTTKTWTPPGGDIRDDAWHFIACARNNFRCTFCVDDSVSDYLEHDVQSVGSPVIDCLIGRNSEAASGYFNGAMDNVMVFLREIKDLQKDFEVLYNGGSGIGVSQLRVGQSQATMLCDGTRWILL